MELEHFVVKKLRFIVKIIFFSERALFSLEGTSLRAART